jgi:hypothetical protein
LVLANRLSCEVVVVRRMQLVVAGSLEAVVMMVVGLFRVKA